MAKITRRENHNPNGYTYENPEEGCFWHAADQRGLEKFNESCLSGKDEKSENLHKSFYIIREAA